MNKQILKPSRSRIIYSATGFIGLILIFVFIIIIGYLPSRSKTVEAAATKQRLAYLKETEDAQNKAATTYQVIDKEKGIVRIPIERAMEIMVDNIASE